VLEPDVQPQRRSARHPFGRRAIIGAVEWNDEAFKAAPRTMPNSEADACAVRALQRLQRVLQRPCGRRSMSAVLELAASAVG
jgi:hypothetical protein